MLRSIGSVTFLALLMVGCGGGGGGPATYTVGGTVTGLSGPGLVLQIGGGNDLPISASGAFTFATGMPSGTSYAVTVKSSPTSPLQVCLVAGGVGTIAGANVKNVDVTCTSGYTIRGTVSGLQGSGLVLQIVDPGHRGHPGHNVGAPEPITSNGSFTIVESPPTVSNGLVARISQQPASPDQSCLVRNAINFQVGNVTDSEVGCSQFAYVANAGDNTVSAYTLDATTGALTALPGFPVGAGTSPFAIVGTQDRKYVFVGNEGSNDISAFAVNFASGVLTPVPGSPFAAGTDPQGMALYGSTLYVANAGSDTVSAYTIDYNTGALTALPGSPVPVGKNPTSIVVDPSTGVVFVANHGGSNDISAFNSFDLTPVPGSPFPAGGNPLSLEFGAGGNFLYTANPDATNPSVSGFSFNPDTGALSPLTGSPFPLPVSHYMAIEQTGIQIGSNSISGYLYVTTDASIVGYAFDWSTGALTALPGFPVAAGANAYSVNILGNQFLYVANDGAANISGFTLDLLTGALTPMAGSPFPAGNHPKFIATF
jgi:6-phosphogluconolactonase